MSAIILPPPDIRNIIDKTALAVLKNGKEFEERIVQKERHNPKFFFLALHDPYHGYYETRLQELLEGGQEAVARIQQEMQAQQQQSETRNSVESRSVAETAPPPPAELLLFLLDLPSISPLDLDIIKMTAQYVARNGRSFLGALVDREKGNVQFDFLRPGHSLHKLFLRLVDQFAMVMLPTQGVLERMQRCKDKGALYDSIVKDRVGFARWQDAAQRKAQADASRDMEEYNRVNWNDFVIVETIEFTTGDKQAHLPAPLDCAAVVSMSLLQRQELWGSGLLPMQHAEKRSPAVPVAEEAAEIPSVKRMAVSDQSGSTARVEVRHDYQPKASASAGTGAHDQLVQCSICGQKIPSSQIQEHMRIELLDSKWAEQRKAHLAKHVDTNIVESGSDVSRNLAAMSKQRSASDRQAMLQQKVIWDGTADSTAAAHREASIKSRDQVQREIEDLQRRGGDVSLDPNTGIGPRIPQQAPAPYSYQYGYPQQLPPGYPPQMPPGYPQQMPPGYPSQMLPGYPMPPPGYYPPPPGQYPGYPGYPPYPSQPAYQQQPPPPPPAPN